MYDRALTCIHSSGGRPLTSSSARNRGDSTTSPAGFPANGLSVKASAWNTGYCALGVPQSQCEPFTRQAAMNADVLCGHFNKQT